MSRKSGAGGRNRTGTGLSALRIFLPATAFAASPCACAPEASLWSGLSLHHGVRREAIALGAARLVSTPSHTRPFGLRRAWLGIATCEVSPTLSSSTSPVSRRALKLRSSPLRLPVSPRPHKLDSYKISPGFDQEDLASIVASLQGLCFSMLPFKSLASTNFATSARRKGLKPDAAF